MSDTPTLKQTYHDCRVFDYFRRIRNAISFAAFPWRSWNRICDILENISGIGCTIEKQTKDNPHWVIAVDPSSGEQERPDSDCETETTTPGQSVERYESSQSSPDPNDGALQLRGFPVANDMLPGIAGQQEAASGGKIAMTTGDFLVRSRQSNARPRLEYLRADNAPFFLRDGTATTNYARSIKIGSASTGYITISVSTYTV